MAFFAFNVEMNSIDHPLKEGYLMQENWVLITKFHSQVKILKKFFTFISFIIVDWVSQ